MTSTSIDIQGNDNYANIILSSPYASIIPYNLPELINNGNDDVIITASGYLLNQDLLNLLVVSKYATSPNARFWELPFLLQKFVPAQIYGYNWNFNNIDLSSAIAGRYLPYLSQRCGSTLAIYLSLFKDFNKQSNGILDISQGLYSSFINRIYAPVTQDYLVKPEIQKLFSLISELLQIQGALGWAIETLPFDFSKYGIRITFDGYNASGEWIINRDVSYSILDAYLSNTQPYFPGAMELRNRPKITTGDVSYVFCENVSGGYEYINVNVSGYLSEWQAKFSNALQKVESTCSELSEWYVEGSFNTFGHDKLINNFCISFFKFLGSLHTANILYLAGEVPSDDVSKNYNGSKFKLINGLDAWDYLFGTIDSSSATIISRDLSVNYTKSNIKALIDQEFPASIGSVILHSPVAFYFALVNESILLYLKQLYPIPINVDNYAVDNYAKGLKLNFANLSTDTAFASKGTHISRGQVWN